MPGVGSTWGRWSLLVVLVVALAAVAPPTAKPRPAKRCARTQLRVRARGASACVGKGAKPKDPVEKVAMRFGLRAAAAQPIHYRHASAKTRRNLAGVHKIALSASGVDALQAAVSLGLTSTDIEPKVGDSQPGPTVDGWQTSVSTDLIPPSDGDSGAGAEVTATATKDVPGATVSQSFSEKWELSVRKCPDEKGVVPAIAVHEMTWGVEASVAGKGRVVARFKLSGKGAESGHVGDDAHLADYDHSVRFYALVQVSEFDAAGRNVTSQPPILFSAHFLRNHVKPPIDYGDAGKDLNINISGLESAGFSKGMKLAQSVARIFPWEFYVLGNKIEPELDRAERGWTEGGCLHVSATADTPTLKPGEASHVTVTIAPPSGESLAPGKLTASVGAGTVSPTSASYGPDGHVNLTFTAPSQGWSSGSSATVQVDVVSREGKSSGDVTVNAAQSGFLLRLSGDMTESFTPVRYSHGTGSATYSAGGQATIADGTGSGALTWNAFSYSDQNVEEGCQDGKLMTANFTGTGTDPGSMTVLGLDLSTGEPVLHLQIHDPIEHVRGDFQPGASACRAFSSDYAFNNWAYLLERMVFDGPSGVTLDFQASGDKLEAFFIGSWQRSGSGWVKDMSYTPSLSAGETGTAHVRLELTPR